MNPTQADVDRAVAAAKMLQQQGRFAKVKTGDERAASYFSRMVASTVNPSGDQNDWGWLSKPAGGFNVEGYADAAIVFGNNAADLNNVLKIVTQAGSSDPNAIQIGSSLQPRRAVDVWVTPVPLPASLPAYLGGSSDPIPPPPPPMPVPPGPDEALDELNWLNAYYQAPEGLQRPQGLSVNGAPDFAGLVAWYLGVYQLARINGKSRADARAQYVSGIRNSDEWKQKHPGQQP